MEQTKKKKELEEIAKRYCEIKGYTFIFANEYKFGFQDENEQLFTISYYELYNILYEEKEKNKNINKVA